MVKFIVGSGQSGAVGGPGMEGGDFTINERVKVWTDAGWAVAEPGKPPFRASAEGQPPLNNTLWQFCKRMQEETGEDVYFVLSGNGGVPIERWDEGRPQWKLLDARVHAAMATPELAGKASADYFAWYHGGADNDNRHYGRDFLDLRSRSIASGWLAEDTRVIYGQAHSTGESKEDMLNLIGSGRNPWLHVADNYGVEYFEDGAHPTGKGCEQYGDAFYEAAIKTYQSLNHLFGATHFDFGSMNDDFDLIASGDTLVRAQEGNDTVEAFGEDNTIFGGLGRDTFNVHDFGEMAIHGGYGMDTLNIDLPAGIRRREVSGLLTFDDVEVVNYI